MVSRYINKKKINILSFATCHSHLKYFFYIFFRHFGSVNICKTRDWHETRVKGSFPSSAEGPWKFVKLYVQKKTDLCIGLHLKNKRQGHLNTKTCWVKFDLKFIWCNKSINVHIFVDYCIELQNLNDFFLMALSNFHVLLKTL